MFGFRGLQCCQRWCYVCGVGMDGNWCFASLVGPSSYESILLDIGLSDIYQHGVSAITWKDDPKLCPMYLSFLANVDDRIAQLGCGKVCALVSCQLLIKLAILHRPIVTMPVDALRATVCTFVTVRPPLWFVGATLFSCLCYPSLLVVNDACEISCT